MIPWSYAPKPTYLDCSRYLHTPFYTQRDNCRRYDYMFHRHLDSYIVLDNCLPMYSQNTLEGQMRPQFDNSIELCCQCKNAPRLRRIYNFMKNIGQVVWTVPVLCNLTAACQNIQYILIYFTFECTKHTHWFGLLKCFHDDQIIWTICIEIWRKYIIILWA